MSPSLDNQSRWERLANPDTASLIDKPSKALGIVSERVAIVGVIHVIRSDMCELGDGAWATIRVDFETVGNGGPDGEEFSKVDPRAGVAVDKVSLNLSLCLDPCHQVRECLELFDDLPEADVVGNEALKLDALNRVEYFLLRECHLLWYG